MKANKRDIVNLLIILCIEIAIVVMCKVFFGTFVISGDYLFQHGVIPDIFRQEFYHTNKLIPDCIFQLGGAQNIYNFSYYGLLSPVILISYLFPAVKMITFMQLASSVMFAATGLLMYVWMRRHFSETESFVAAIMMLLIPPVLYGFQNQVVFVECLPFVLLSLIAVDRRFKNGGNTVLILTMTLMICVNYYSSIMSLFCVFAYYAYRYLLKYKKVTLRSIVSIVRPIIVSIMISGILLIPTAYVILHGIRIPKHKYNFWELFLIPDYEGMYKPSEMGITMIFVFSVIAILFNSRKIIEEKFISITLMLMTFCPFILFALNGGNYIRNKTAIPLWPLWCMIFILMYRKMKNNTLKYKRTLITFFVLCVTVVAYVNFLKTPSGNIFSNKAILMILIDGVITIIAVLLCRFTTKKYLCIIFTILPMLVYSTFLEVQSMHTVYFANDTNVKKVTDRVLKDDNEVYRFGNNLRGAFNMNKAYSDKYMTDSIYTSTHNKNYWEFYFKTFGNNKYYRNYLMLYGAHNSLFQSYMGERYIVDDSLLNDINYDFLPEYSSERLKVYKNDGAFPMIYGKKNTVSTQEFNKLKFPYTLDCIMNYAIIDNGQHNKDTGNAHASNQKSLYLPKGKIKPYGLDKIKKRYKFDIKEDKEYSINLDESVIGKYLVIEFDVKQSGKDLRIDINGSRNVCSSTYAEYDNQNRRFRYILSSKNQLDKLNIFITAGNYDISNVNIYTYDLDLSKIEMDKGIVKTINHQNSTVTATLNAEENEQMVTSFSYDEGWTIYVDGKKTDKKKVNTAFLGCDIPKGKHDIKMVYSVPWKMAGIVCSAAGLLLFMLEIILDIRQKNHR